MTRKVKRKDTQATTRIDSTESKRIQINVRVSQQLHELLKYEAWKQRTSLNQYILNILDKRDKVW